VNRIYLHMAMTCAMAHADDFIEPPRWKQPKKVTGERINDPRQAPKAKSASLKKLLSRKARP
jgi:hypothetical protein